MIPSEAARIVRELHDIVWTSGELSAVDRLVAPQYVIHSDPGDPWEGQTLDRATYRERVRYSRTGFPDLTFTIHDLIATEHRVCVRWSAEGTHLGARAIPGTPVLLRVCSTSLSSSGRAALTFSGVTSAAGATEAVRVRRNRTALDREPTGWVVGG